MCNTDYHRQVTILLRAKRKQQKSRQRRIETKRNETEIHILREDNINIYIFLARNKQKTISV